MRTKSYRKLHRDLGIPDDYASLRKLPYYAEARDLVDVGPNLVGRMQRLTPAAAAVWQSMTAAAAADGIRLLLVSGFRSHSYQGELIRRKLDSGQSIADILRVNAAPGFSQHHSGKAVDVASPGSRPLTEEFEASDAFRWLVGNAAGFGFSLSYPRDNIHALAFEPWHWSL